MGRAAVPRHVRRDALREEDAPQPHGVAAVTKALNRSSVRHAVPGVSPSPSSLPAAASTWSVRLKVAGLATVRSKGADSMTRPDATGPLCGCCRPWRWPRSPGDGRGFGRARAMRVAVT